MEGHGSELSSALYEMTKNVGIFALQIVAQRDFLSNRKKQHSARYSKMLLFDDM
jgi:hypothetical protein